MSTFTTYSSEKGFIEYFIRNSKRFNALLIAAYFISCSGMILLGQKTHSHIFLYFMITGFVLFIGCYFFYRRFLKKMKPAGTLELSQNSINIKNTNEQLAIQKEDIEEIIISRKFKQPFSSNDYHFIIVDLIQKDKSSQKVFIKKNSDSNEKYELLKTLQVFSKINHIKLITK